jgi:hypothetical protein
VTAAATVDPEHQVPTAQRAVKSVDNNRKHCAMMKRSRKKISNLAQNQPKTTRKLDSKGPVNTLETLGVVRPNPDSWNRLGIAILNRAKIAV